MLDEVVRYSDGILFKYPEELDVIVTPSGNVTVPVNVGLANVV